MKKLVKIVLGFVAVLVVAALVIPHFISVDSLKPRIVAAVEEQTGKRLKLDGEMRLAFFPVAGLHVENASLVNLNDGKEEAFIALKSLDISLDLLALISGHINIGAFALNEPDIRLHVNKAGVQNWAMQPKASKSRGKSDTAPLAITLSNLQINNGKLSYIDESTGDKWDVSDLQMNSKMDSLASPMTAQFDAKVNGEPVSLDATISTPESLMESESAELELMLGGSMLDGRFKGKLKGQDLNGQLELSSASLVKLMRWAQPFAPPLAVGTPLALQVKGAAAISPVFIKLTQATLTLDAIKAEGDLSFAAGEGGHAPRINANLKTGLLDLTPYMTPSQKQASASWLISDAFAATAGWSDAPIDYAALRSIESNLALRFDGIQLNQFTIGKGALDSELKLGSLELQLSDTALYEGKAAINLKASAEGKALAAKIDLKGVQAEKLLRDSGIYDGLEGKMNAQLNVTAQGKSERELVSNLNGNGSVRIEDGALKGYNIAQMARDIKSIYSPQKSGSQKTDFSELGGTFTIASGIVTNKDLAMKAPLLRLTGSGTLSLPPRTVNYRVVPELVGSLKGQGGKDKAGLEVPFLITGSMDAPTIQPDARGLIEDAVKNPEKLKEQVKSVKETIKSPEMKQNLKDLKGLLKGF